eukprot:RCo054015
MSDSPHPLPGNSRTGIVLQPRLSASAATAFVAQSNGSQVFAVPVPALCQALGIIPAEFSLERLRGLLSSPTLPVVASAATSALPSAPFPHPIGPPNPPPPPPRALEPQQPAFAAQPGQDS